MRRFCRDLGLCVVAIVAGFALAGTAAAAKPDKLSTAIQQRLAKAGNLTFPMTPVSDYFSTHMLKPESGFYTDACLNSGQPFRFGVAIYKTAAQAAVAYNQGLAHVRAIGGDFHAFWMARSGRVLYMGSTAGGPSPSDPTLPLKAFHSMVGLADGATWSHGRGCGSIPRPTNQT
jgi:hypothetical protein